MTKYKAGDKVTFLVHEAQVERLNKHKWAYVCDKDIIDHEPAPEPIVTYSYVLKSGYTYGSFRNLDEAKNSFCAANLDILGYIKITHIDNDFTVEKVTE